MSPADATPGSEDLLLEIGGMTLEPGGRIGPYVFRRVAGKGGMAIKLEETPDPPAPPAADPNAKAVFTQKVTLADALSR